MLAFKLAGSGPLANPQKASNPIDLLMGDCDWYEITDSGDARINIAELAGNLAYHAMMLEAHLTPKAGLVDCVSHGAHKDMTIDTFSVSADAIRPYMKHFVNTGYHAKQSPSRALLTVLRPVGLLAEQAMFSATNHVNTHKGMIFTMGLICGAVGWLYANRQAFDASHIRGVIKSCCSQLVSAELSNRPALSGRPDLSSQREPSNPGDLTADALTAGEKIFVRYGITGIRGEAVAGYPTIFEHGLPAYEAAIASGLSEEQALSKTLLVLMANNQDTNLINRGGMAGLSLVQQHSTHLLSCWQQFSDDEMRCAIQDFDRLLIRRNLSPGGSADLLAATWLLAQLNQHAMAS